MGKQAKKVVVLSGLSEGFEFESVLLDTPIVCKCGHETTRRDCECKPSYYDDITYLNYYCDSCGNFLRCDSAFTPLPVKQVAVEGDSGDDNE